MVKNNRVPPVLGARAAARFMQALQKAFELAAHQQIAGAVTLAVSEDAADESVAGQAAETVVAFDENDVLLAAGRCGSRSDYCPAASNYGYVVVFHIAPVLL